ncbi:MAG TPA: hypothetical protein ENL34_13140, partial [Chloroflexi bacterium]|nr:hypothetical protein [Chloroflexota bacterium]
MPPVVWATRPECRPRSLRLQLHHLSKRKNFLIFDCQMGSFLVAKNTRKAGHNQTEIAGIIKVHKSTVSRELRRNRGLRGYRPKQAHLFA